MNSNALASTTLVATSRMAQMRTVDERHPPVVPPSPTREARRAEGVDPLLPLEGAPPASALLMRLDAALRFRELDSRRPRARGVLDIEAS